MRDGTSDVGSSGRNRSTQGDAGRGGSYFLETEEVFGPDLYGERAKEHGLTLVDPFWVGRRTSCPVPGSVIPVCLAVVRRRTLGTDYHDLGV